jgi:hypothetical protein
LTLGREKWHEYLFTLIWGNAGTIVCDHDGHATVRITVGGQRDETGRSVAECLDRVPDQIDEGLIKQFDVCSDFEYFRLDTCRQSNVAGRQVTGEEALQSRENALYGRNLYLRHQVFG